MKRKSLIDTYLQKYSAGEKWQLKANETDDISQVVVIPAYAEKDSLFSTLVSLAENPPSALENSLIMCVVNNSDNDSFDVKENNLRTIEYLDALIGKTSIKRTGEDRNLYTLLIKLSDANLKLGYINASSRNYELPQDIAGVGMARKIGMDMALRLLKNSPAANNLIISLDADTLVRNNYLSSIKKHFSKGARTAILAYEHQMPSESLPMAAICSYEIFLRYWVLGLQYAKSPWAFHSIGSTIVTSAEAYLEVRGMNKRKAGEDFYFLSKLAKTGKIDYIRETCVYPSPRTSARVPFGTGKRIQKFLSGNYKEGYSLYDPRIFKVLADWLLVMKNPLTCDEDDVLLKAQKIHTGLNTFLNDAGFPAIWSKICRNVKDEKTLSKQFNDWFDGFKTLKMINYFTREFYPQINMFEALEQIISMSEIRFELNTAGEIPPLMEQIRILQYLRTIT
jgi:hypothetical protein